MRRTASGLRMRRQNSVWPAGTASPVFQVGAFRIEVDAVAAGLEEDGPTLEVLPVGQGGDAEAEAGAALESALDVGVDAVLGAEVQLLGDVAAEDDFDLAAA